MSRWTHRKHNNADRLIPIGISDWLHSMNLKPSIFTERPWESLAQNTETEIIARNMMVIRKRLGDEWPLTWKQYEREREKDGGQGCAHAEKSYFDNLIKQIPDAIGAISFSPTWAKAARAAAV